MKKISILCSSVVLGGLLFIPNVTKAATEEVEVEAEVEEVPSASEITPYVVFTPDRCVMMGQVQRWQNGWNIWTPGGGTYYFLPDSGKVGSKDPVVNKEVEIMLNSQGSVVGWRVL